MRSFPISILTITICSLVSCLPNRTEQPIALPTDNRPLIWPDSLPNSWLLAHLDVETTGLIPDYHEMIDLGLALTDLQGHLIDTFFVRIQPEHPERLDPGAYAVNAYEPKKWEAFNALSADEALDALTDFQNQYAQDKRVLLVAYNSHFDASFLDHLFRSADRSWRELYFYYVLDIPSMAWALGFTGLRSKEVLARFGLVDEPRVAELHTGITGALVNARMYKALMTYRSELLQKPLTQ